MVSSDGKQMLRSLPAVDELLHQKAISDAVESHPRILVVRDNWNLRMKFGS